eukprot:1036549-Pyramimonas_sp.AAC.1
MGLCGVVCFLAVTGTGGPIKNKGRFFNYTRWGSTRTCGARKHVGGASNSPVVEGLNKGLMAAWSPNTHPPSVEQVHHYLVRRAPRHLVACETHHIIDHLIDHITVAVRRIVSTRPGMTKRSQAHARSQFRCAVTVSRTSSQSRVLRHMSHICLSCVKVLSLPSKQRIRSNPTRTPSVSEPSDR